MKTPYFCGAMVVLININEHEILIYVQVVRFRRFNQAVNNSTGLCTVGRMNHYKVFSTNCEWADGLFG